MTGDLCIVGGPNEFGETGIGCATCEEFQSREFMTGIVSGITRWALTRPIVKSIVASTDKTNTASFKVPGKISLVKLLRRKQYLIGSVRCN
jgi:[ribosomal protein S5]-alanine N-acetyltransferase